MMNEEEIDDEHDPYLELLAEIGRTLAQDQRVAYHELGHILIDRVTGHSSISFASITPRDGYEGICRGTRREAFVSNGVAGTGCIDAATVCQILAPQMPKAGESRDDKSDIYASVLDACTQLMAGEASEQLLLGEASFAFDDRRQASELASLICKTPQAIERFIEFCSQQATDMLSENITVLLSLDIVLRIAREMTGEQIDRAIVTALAAEAAAVERRRRADWRKRELAASSFQIECGHANVASLPRAAPDRVT
jgi:hypothetical protein